MSQSIYATPHDSSVFICKAVEADEALQNVFGPFPIVLNAANLPQLDIMEKMGCSAVSRIVEMINKFGNITVGTQILL